MDKKDIKILIIDDNERNRKLERDLLQVSGYNVIEAVTAEDGIEKTKNENPDLILMDYQLPGMDGLEAINAIRKIPSFEDMKFVIVTASATKTQLDDMKVASKCPIIIKPINTREFVKEIEGYLLND